MYIATFFFLCAFFTMHFEYVILQCKKYCYKYKVLNYKVDLNKFVHCPAIIGVKTGLSPRRKSWLHQD